MFPKTKAEFVPCLTTGLIKLTVFKLDEAIFNLTFLLAITGTVTSSVIERRTVSELGSR